MRMRVLPPLAALVLGAATALLVACGGSDGRIPAGDASSLTSALNQISSDYRAGQCVAAQRAVTKAQNDVLALPDTVDARLRQRLQSGIQNLAAKVPATCEPGADPDAADPDRHGHDGHRDHRHGHHRHRHDRYGDHRDRHRDPPTTPTGTTATSSTGTTTGTDTGAGGTSVGGVTVP